jgi:thymidylate synthase
MSEFIKSQNCLSAWKDACNYILNHGNGYNLIVKIESPLEFNLDQKAEILNSKIISNLELQNVINTIFPSRLYERNLHLFSEDFYNLHENLYEKGKTLHRKNKSRWGNYFLRFTRFGSQRLNQLQEIIEKINIRPKQQAACYYMHVSSIEIDTNTRTIGNPCLQYVQFAQQEGKIHLTAVYRNHDFLLKALGNYIGLAKLLEFVCKKTNSEIGSVTCHSIHFYLDKKRVVKNCIESFTW